MVRPGAGPEPEFPLDGPLTFLQSLWALDHALQSTSKRMRRSSGITGQQRLVLRVLGLYPGLTPGQVARILFLHPSTLTGVLRRLHRGGFLQRTMDTSDRRKEALELTERGRRVARRRAGTIEEAVARTVAGFGPEEVRTALAVLGRLTGELSRTV